MSREWRDQEAQIVLELEQLSNQELARKGSEFQPGTSYAQQFQLEFLRRQADMQERTATAAERQASAAVAAADATQKQALIAQGAALSAARQAKAADDAAESAKVAMTAAVDTARYTRRTAFWMGLSAFFMLAGLVIQACQK